VCLAPRLDRLVEAPLPVTGFGQAEIRVRVVRVGTDRVFIQGNRCVEVLGPEQVVRFQNGEIGALRIQLPRPSSQLQRLVRTAERPVLDSKRAQHMGIEIADGELQEAPPRLLCASPIPVEQKRQRVREGVRLGQVGIDLERLPHVTVDLWPRVGRPLEAVGDRHRVIAGERRERQRELRIANHGALQQFA
jgi:hypothetical protein